MLGDLEGGGHHGHGNLVLVGFVHRSAEDDVGVLGIASVPVVSMAVVIIPVVSTAMVSIAVVSTAA